MRRAKCAGPRPVRRRGRRGVLTTASGLTFTGDSAQQRAGAAHERRHDAVARRRSARVGNSPVTYRDRRAAVRADRRRQRAVRLLASGAAALVARGSDVSRSRPRHVGRQSDSDRRRAGRRRDRPRAARVSRPLPGWSEQDPRDWIAAAERAIGALRTANARALAAVRGIGLSGQMHGATLLDERDEPLRPCLLWNDTRAHAEAAALDGDARFRE